MPNDEQFPLTRVVVVGANGFIGRRLVDALVREPGYRPVAAVRRHPAATQADVVLCDATDRAAMERALAGAAYAVNCVAGSDGAMVAATNAICDAARRTGLRRLVHLSSMAVYGAATGLVDEAHAAVPPVSGYGMAKQACEQVVRDFITDGGEAAILRPGCVYGPGSEQWTGRIGRLLQAGRLGDLGAEGDGVCNLTYIDDLVAAIVACLTRDEAANQTFNIASADPPDWNTYLTRFARQLGATPIQRLSARRLKLETKLAAPALRLTAISARLGRLKIRLPDAITPSLAALFRQDIRLDVHNVSERLGLHETSLEWGLAASARWLTTGRMQGSGQRHDSLVEAPQR